MAEAESGHDVSAHGPTGRLATRERPCPLGRSLPFGRPVAVNQNGSSSLKRMRGKLPA
jgi:hypothetical protein